jgi:hypothetical protein
LGTLMPSHGQGEKTPTLIFSPSWPWFQSGYT